MMYIEHTNLEDNLHQILTNRVPTSSSPSATEASAPAAASALLARVREAQQDSASTTLQQEIAGVQQVPSANCNSTTTTTNNYHHNKFTTNECIKRPEPKLLPLDNLQNFKVPKELKQQPTTVPPPHPENHLESNNRFVTVAEEEEPEEQYELLQVSDLPIETPDTFGLSKQLNEPDLEEVDNLPGTSHFVIELQTDDHKIANPSHQIIHKDEDEEFEYVVTRVPKRKQYQQQQLQDTFKYNQQTNQYSPELKRKVRRPVPEAIPIDSQASTRSFNGPLPPLPKLRPTLRKHSISAQEFYTHREVNGYTKFIVDHNNEDYSDSETLEAASTGQPENACNNGRYSRQEAQMGLDIINKIKELFNWNISENFYSTVPKDGKRKRRSENWSGETADPHQIKYRRVENRFPKYIAAHSEEDDAIEFLPPRPYQQQQQHHQYQQQQQQQLKSTKYDKQYNILNNSATQNSRNILEMSNRRSNAAQDKPSLRKSMFSAPNVTQQLIKNTTYADIEFSDDDEPILLKGFDIKPSTSSAVNKHVPKVYNIPIMRTNEHLKSMQQKPPPPPLIEPRTGSILQSSLIPELQSLRKPTYAEAVRLSHPSLGATGGGTGHVLGGRSSISSSVASTSESSRIFNGLRTNHWPNQNRSSILDQEKESEEREKYQQLLEQIAPRLYGVTGGESKHLSSNSLAQRRRSGLLLGAALTSSARSSPANNRRSVGLGQPMLKRPPLSSTINLDDDEADEDVTITGVSHLKTSRSLKPKQNLPSTVIIDDDEISDIVELGNEERHVLSACAKIQKEENAIVNLLEDKVEKPKKASLPFVEPVNSFQERINASPHMKDNWLENFQSKWFQRKKNRNDEVKKIAKVAETTSAERRAAEVEIQERLRKFSIVDPELVVIDDFEDVVEEPEFVVLTQQHRNRINAAICGPPDQVLISKFNLNITRRDLHTLCGHNWLNDEVINFYMNLLTERGEKKHDSHGLPKVYAMNTFFIPRLLQDGHAGVRRWTRKVDIFSKDIVPVPVHVGGVHWCMAIIHLKNRTIKYYDSMGTPNTSVLKALEQYLKDESKDKRKQPYDTSGYVIESVQGVPRQMNGSDCGVFSCMFAEYITRNREITFSQQDMEYFRQKMILEIVTGELLQ